MGPSGIDCSIKLMLIFLQKVDEVLSMASDDVLKNEKNGASPGPMVEVEFWKAKCFNLESLFDQVSFKTFEILIQLLRTK